MSIRADMLATMYNWLLQTSGNSMFTDAQLYAFLSQAQNYIGIERQVASAEEPLALVLNQWEYDLPTPSATYSKPAGAASYSAVKEIRWTVTGTVNLNPVLQKCSYEEIVSLIYNTHYTPVSALYGFWMWANHPEKPSFAIYPKPQQAYTIDTSPMIVSYYVRPGVIDANTDPFINQDYHQALCKLAVGYALQSKQDNRAMVFIDDALKLIDSIRAQRVGYSLTHKPFISNKAAFRIPR